jgi:hypothetical protein
MIFIYLSIALSIGFCLGIITMCIIQSARIGRK